MTELLIVITIIGILMALSAGVYLQQSKHAQIEATRSMIRSVNDALSIRIEAFFSSVRNNNIPANTVRDPLSNDPGNVPNATRAQLIAKIERFRTEFPQEFGDFLRDSFTTNNDMPAIRQRYIQYFNENYRFGQPDNRHEMNEYGPEGVRTESAECLYMILKLNQREGMSSPVDELSRFVKDTDNDGLPEIVDAWGVPLRFYRWPVDLISYYEFISPTGLGLVIHMPNALDPEGLLYSTPWFDQPSTPSGYGDIGRAAFENGLTPYAPCPTTAFIARQNPPADPDPLAAGSPYATANLNPTDPNYRVTPRHFYFRLHKPYFDVSAGPITVGVGTDPNALPNYLPAPDQPARLPIIPLVVSAGPDHLFGLFDWSNRFRYDSTTTIPNDTYSGANANSEPTPLSIRCGRVDLRRLSELGDNLTSLLLQAEGMQR